MKFGWTYPLRKKHIEKLQKSKTTETFGVRFQGNYKPLPIYDVSVEFPKYRLENGRTGAAQEEYIATHKGVSNDFFSKDPESDTAQKVQHEILKEMISQSGLHSYFKKHEQEEPIILTSDAIVINGNRRLCSMREHYNSKNDTYKRYRNVRVVILPPADEKELDWLEGKEQIQEDIKANYSWTATAIMYRRRMRRHKLTVKELAAIYEEKSANVQELLDMLEHAEIFLHNSGKPGLYHTLDGDEYAFRQLRKNRKKIKNVEKREVFDHLCYAVIEQPIGDRAYQTVADIQTHMNKIGDTIEKEVAPKQANTPQPTKKKKGKSASALLGGSKTVATDLLDIVSNTKNRTQVREVLRDVIGGEKIASKENKTKSYALAQTKSANQALGRAVDDIARKGTKSSKTGVAAQLNEIDECVKKIRDWLDGKTQN